MFNKLKLWIFVIYKWIIWVYTISFFARSTVINRIKWWYRKMAKLLAINIIFSDPFEIIVLSSSIDVMFDTKLISSLIILRVSWIYKSFL